MTREQIQSLYFKWLCDLVTKDQHRRGSFKKILTFLDSVDFYYVLPMDGNRYEDGIELRYRFGISKDISDCVIAEHLDDRPCSVLEMMVALSLRCEETIMDNPEAGNRTGYWFWKMMDSLGLSSMSDSRFSYRKAETATLRFLNRDYMPNGKGGLFTVDHYHKDLRSVEIWYQMMWFLESLETEGR